MVALVTAVRLDVVNGESRGGLLVTNMIFLSKNFT